MTKLLLLLATIALPFPRAAFASPPDDRICVLQQAKFVGTENDLIVRPTPDGHLEGIVAAVGIWKGFPKRDGKPLASERVEKNPSGYEGENFRITLPTADSDGLATANLAGYAVDVVLPRQPNLRFPHLVSADDCLE